MGPPHHDDTLRAVDDPASFAQGLEALARMSAALTAVDDEERLYQVASEHIQDLIPVERASVALISSDGSRFHVRCLHGEIGAASPGEVVQGSGRALQTVARTRRYFYVPDLTSSDLVDLATLRQHGFRSAIVVPLVAGDVVIGTFNLASTRPHGFSDDEIRLLGHAGQFLGLAIMSVRRLEAATNAERASALAHELAAHRVREIESLNRVFRILNEVSPVEQRLSRVAGELTSLRGVDLCRLALVDDDGELRTIISSDGDGRSSPADPAVDVAALTEAVQQRRPIWDGETEDDGSWTAQQLAIPMMLRGEAVGALALISVGPQTFGASQGVLAETVGAQIANALERDQMIAELRHAADTADAASRARSRFLANMSHELRTPMNGVIGMVSLLEETELTPQQRMYVEMIRTSGEAQVSVINHILDFSKIEADMLVLRPEPFDLRRCVEDGLDLAASTVGSKPVDLCYEVDPDLPVSLVGDAIRIRQVLINLLTNAAKFTERGEIVVRVDDFGPRSGDGPAHWLRISVRDTGPGIPADRIEWLFEPFTQLSAVPGHGDGGSGLGLSIARQMVELMGGAITVDSVEGVGSTFHVTLPLAVDPDPPDGIDARTHQPRLAGRRAVVAGPLNTSRMILERTLRAWDVAVVTADCIPPTPGHLLGGASAPVDVLIVDHRLRGSTADAAAWQRVSQALGAPLVTLCNMGVANQQDPSLVLTRPVKPAHLAACLHHALGIDDDDDRAEPADRAGPGSAPPPGQRQPLRVLVAEDNKVNQTVALALLARLGYPADVAVDGLEAVAAATTAPGYDLILMDLKMPGMNGIEATQEIRRLVIGRQPRIVAVTADTVSLVRQSCLDAGMDDFLSKPVRVEELTATLDATARAVAAPDPEIDEQALELLAEVVGHVPGVVDEILAAFLTDAPELVAEVSRGADTGDLERVIDAAHPLVSSSATVGAHALSAQAVALVAGARAGAAPTADQLAALQATAIRVVAELRRRLPV